MDNKNQNNLTYMLDTTNSLINQRPTINPYRYAAYEVWRRLQWDINPESWRSRSLLKGWKDKYRDRKAVIVCNGPSLLKSDLSLLKETFTFGLNKINLLFDRSNFRPSCIVAVNQLVLEQNTEFYNQTDIPLFLNNYAVKFITKRPNVAFLYSSFQPKFARDCSISIYQGYTVTFVAMQLAFHMGFRDVALIGCDHNFVTKGPANATVVSKEKDENHFDPRYFSGGSAWQLPDLLNSESNYNLANNVFNSFGRRLINCTEGGNLEIIERKQLSSWLNDAL